MDTVIALPETQAPADPPAASHANTPATGEKKRGRPPNSATTTKTGRPPKSSAPPETPQQRIDRLKAELQKAEEAKQRAEELRDSIVGKIVVAHALAHDDYRRKLTALLKAEVKSKTDLAALAEFLA